MRKLGLVAVLVGGCTWISQGDIEERRGDLDDDKDGYIAGEDCDDSDPTISPGAEEVWYDGVDSDCLGDDDYDADGDGYVLDEHAGMATAGVTTSGLLPSGDCDDSNDIISPEGADAWYDGVDTDCAGNDDYDQDGDGYVSEANGGLVTQYVDGSGALSTGDCDDLDADIHPDADDDWYDGVDTDCAGNDDYDKDGDGYVSDEDVGLATVYADGTGSLPGGDCDDDNSSAYAGAPDTPYDGVDWDCAQDDDYDQDGDGYVPDLYENEVTVGLPESGALPAGDCDDTDGDVNPGAVEILSDNRDLDCESGGQAFIANALENFSGWDTPIQPTFDENVLGVFLSLGASQLKQNTTNYYDSALAVSFDGTDPLGGITGTYVWLKHVVQPSSYSITGGHDFLLTNEYLFGITGLAFNSSRSLRLGGFDLLDGVNGLSGQLVSTNDTTEPFEDMSLAIDDDGFLYGIACESGDGVAQYFRASLTSAISSDVDAETTIEGVSADACELSIQDATNGMLLSAQAGGLAADVFDLTDDEPTLTRVDTDSSYDARSISVPEHDEWLVIADPGAIYATDSSGSTYALAVGEGPLSAEASIGPGGELIIAYVDSGGDAHVLFGDPAAGMDSFDIVTDFAATEAAAWAESTGTYLMVTVTGPTDVAYGVAAR